MMTTFRVDTPQWPDPGWLNQVRCGSFFATVDSDRSVVVEGVRLRLSEPKPEPGTAVKVWLSGSGFFVGATLEEVEREAQVRRDADESRALQRRATLNARREDALSFNSKIKLPVRWDVGVKDVLSGLSESSMGDGRSKATVEHIYLQEPLQAGRIQRMAGDFLCTSSKGSNGKRWTDRTVSTSYDGDGKPFQSKVTCKACLRVADRWIINVSPSMAE